MVICDLTSKLRFQVVNCLSLNCYKMQLSHLSLILRTDFFKAAVQLKLFPLWKILAGHSPPSILTWCPCYGLQQQCYILLMVNRSLLASSA